MEIAIVGLGCRFPNARDPLGYWELIRNGTVTFRPIPGSRWEVFEHSGHLPYFEEPEKFMQVVGDFLGKP